MADVKLEARVREGRGGKDARALRAAGEIPGVIYTSTSGEDGATPICVGARDLRTAVSGPGGQHAIIDLTIDVKDTDQLAYLMGKIANFTDVISILRLFGRTGK